MARGQQTEKKKKPIKYFDYSLLFLIIFLLCFGLVMLYSTSSYAGSNKFGDASYFVKKQLFATGLGIVGMYIVSKIPYRFWMKVSSMAYLAAIVLCTAVIFYWYRGKRSGEMVKNRAVIFPAVRVCQVCGYYFSGNGYL